MLSVGARCPGAPADARLSRHFRDYSTCVSSPPSLLSPPSPCRPPCTRRRRCIITTIATITFTTSTTSIIRSKDVADRTRRPLVRGGGSRRNGAGSGRFRAAKSSCRRSEVPRSRHPRAVTPWYIGDLVSFPRFGDVPFPSPAQDPSLGRASAAAARCRSRPGAPLPDRGADRRSQASRRSGCDRKAGRRPRVAPNSWCCREPDSRRLERFGECL